MGKVPYGARLRGRAHIYGTLTTKGPRGPYRNEPLRVLGWNFRLCAVSQAGPFLDPQPLKGRPYGKVPYKEALTGKVPCRDPYGEEPLREMGSLPLVRCRPRKKRF